MKLTIDKQGNNELLLIEGADNADILPGTKYFRNFAGVEKRHKTTGKVVNSAGRRNFCLKLDFPTEVLDELYALGLDIVEFASQNQEEYGDEPLRFVRIQISEGGKAPSRLWLSNSSNKKKKEIFNKEIDLLDNARFSKVELVVRTWHKEDGTVSLYLNSGFFEQQMNPIEAKYADFDEVLGDDFDENEGLPF